MRKLTQTIKKHVPHIDRLALVLLFGVFAFTVVMDIAWYVEATIVYANGDM